VGVRQPPRNEVREVSERGGESKRGRERETLRQWEIRRDGTREAGQMERERH
jgi:hypothetical protein